MTIGILSNAPLDVVASVPTSLLAEFDLARLQCTQVEWAVARKLDSRFEELGVVPSRIPGGCGANIAAWLKLLGFNPTIVAPFARDLEGRLVRSSLTDLHIDILGYDYDGDQSRAYTLITEDRERTFASVSGDVPTDILPHALRHMRGEAFFLIDGYYLENEGAIDGLIAFLESDRIENQKVILCPNDTSVLRQHDTSIERLLDYTDCLIMNEIEAGELFGPDCDFEIADYLSEQGKLGAITDGVFGATIFDKAGAHAIKQAHEPRPKVNTNGAGDAFAAGFIAGMMWGLDLTGCGELGRLCAGEILTATGARPELFQARDVLKACGRLE